MQITLNGRIKEIDGRTAFAVRRQFGAETDIVILNGFQIDQDRTLSEKDSLTIIRKGVMPAAEELENMMMARHTPAVHEKLKQGRVAIAGLGVAFRAKPLVRQNANQAISSVGLDGVLYLLGVHDKDLSRA